MSDNDDEPSLCPTTITALREFLEEKEKREKQLADVFQSNQLQHVSFEEDWQLSQFWYDENTTNTIVKGALKSTPVNGKIALISCPTVYIPLKKMCEERQVTLLEYDSRFAVFGSDFISYDYNFPLNIPKDLYNSFDLVIADPPFLSDECLTKTAVTIKLLSKNKIVLCTGAIMMNLVKRLLAAEKCDFLPKHKNNLANEFYCYSNFNFDEMLK
ncbi:PREDICTED: protein-lysine N-methyltransferase n6amt2 [Polistes canadensis]|uniref:protein-lysine N-methyltransferase n6amt2 n=1 Tax=Polistes canadensis TaxID=91411 RepID=UPI000718AEE6|nr:PREDICTED: protein-lysine N-methyltransferase n6amt2 [Polistes canadensis]